jgi:hypothetical protein
VIQSLDETIKKILTEKGPLDPREVEISFDVPKRDWAAGLTRPTVNLYLYDIRENLQLRETQQTWIVKRDIASGTTSRRRPPMRIDVSYLITAWTRVVEDEHALLWAVLATLFEYPELPEALLTGALKGQEVPVRTEIARVDGVLRNAADFWTALDNQLKPSLNYQVTLPLDIELLKKTPGPPVLKLLGRLTDLDEPARQEELRVVAGLGGAVSRQEDGLEVAVAGARVSLVEAGRTVLSDPAGLYRFVNLEEGDYTIKIEKEGFQTEERKVQVDGERCRTLNFALKRN